MWTPPDHRTGIGRRRATLLVAAVVVLGGCAPAIHDRRPPPLPGQPADSAVTGCRTLYRTVDLRVARAGVRDAQAMPVPGFPYLRINRFLASMEISPSGPDFEAWIDRLQDLDRDARRLELRNLRPPPEPGWSEALGDCATILRAAEFAVPGNRAAVLSARVPDAYGNGLRLLGLYPLTALPFLAGVANLHRETEATFATPLSALPLAGSLRRYAPPGAQELEPAEVADIITRATGNPLSLPDPDPEALERLIANYAPIWEIDTATSADLPGRPYLDHSGTPQVAGPPRVYTLTSMTRWRGRTVLQLNYVLWFPARPRDGPFDLLGGNLDGVTWRVTLGHDGRPVLYDAMHNCGCYYMAFPTPRSALSSRRRGFEEPLAVPQAVADGDGRLVLRIASASHYLQRVYRDSEPGADDPYDLVPYDELRSLPLITGGHRSLFRPDGIVPGTERGERWLFWPMGVPEPGAMRQWGTHAIAFVGRRHFDDPDLLDRYFEPDREKKRTRRDPLSDSMPLDPSSASNGTARSAQ